MGSCILTGFFSAPGIPRPDAGEGTLPKSHSPGTPWTSILETGRSAILHRSPYETIQTSLSRGFYWWNQGGRARWGHDNNSGEHEEHEKGLCTRTSWSVGQCDDRQGSTDQGIFLCLKTGISPLTAGVVIWSTALIVIIIFFSPSSSKSEGLSTNSVTTYPSHMQGNA